VLLQCKWSRSRASNKLGGVGGRIGGTGFGGGIGGRGITGK